MDSDNASQETSAQRLTQLADLHREGVLSAREYEAAVASIVGGSSSPVEGEHSPDAPTVIAPDNESNHASSGPPSTPRSDQSGGTGRKRGVVIVIGVVGVVLVAALVFLGPFGGDKTYGTLLQVDEDFRAQGITCESTSWTSDMASEIRPYVDRWGECHTGPTSAEGNPTGVAVILFKDEGVRSTWEEEEFFPNLDGEDGFDYVTGGNWAALIRPSGTPLTQQVMDALGGSITSTPA